MKIQELRLRNFSSHADSTLKFERPVALVVGQLNAGKSSVLQAIEYVLCGECGYHRKRTDNKSELVRGAGQFGTMLSAVTLSNGAASRGRNGKDNVESLEWNGNTATTEPILTASVEAATGVKQSILSALFNTSGFFNLEDAKQKEIIIGLIGAEVTDVKVRSAWTGEAEALDILKSPVASLQALDNAYKYCYDRRTFAKRELADLKPPPAPEGTAPPVDRIKAKLQKIEDELHQAVAAKGRLEGAAAAVSGRQRLEIEAKELRNVLGKVLPNMDPVVADLESYRQMAAEAGESVKVMEEEVIDAKVRLATCESNVQLLAAFKGRCVAGDHACPAPMADMLAAKTQQEKLVADLNEQVKVAIERLNNLCTVRDDRTKITELENRLRQHESVLLDRKKWAARLNEVAAELDKKNPAVDTDEIAKLETQITELRTRIGNGKTQVESAQSWVERDKQVRAVAVSRAKLETEIRYLEELCKFLGKDGVRIQLIDEKIGNFVNQIQSYLQPFGFTLELTVEPWTIAINGQPIKRLSTSERYRLSVAFQVGIAKMSEANMVICDGAEILTPPIFGQMMQMLSTAGLDQVIVLKTLMIPNEQFLAARKSSPAIECFLVTNTDGVSSVEKLM